MLELPNGREALVLPADMAAHFSAHAASLAKIEAQIQALQSQKQAMQEEFSQKTEIKLGAVESLSLEELKKTISELLNTHRELFIEYSLQTQLQSLEEVLHNGDNQVTFLLSALKVFSVAVYRKTNYIFASSLDAPNLAIQKLLGRLEKAVILKDLPPVPEAPPLPPFVVMAPVDLQMTLTSKEKPLFVVSEAMLQGARDKLTAPKPLNQRPLEAGRYELFSEELATTAQNFQNRRKPVFP